MPGGKLEFQRDLVGQLELVNFLIFPGGEVIIGDLTNPFTGKLSVYFRNVPIDTNIDPQQYGNGLLVAGKLCINSNYASYFQVDSSILPAGSELTIKNQSGSDLPSDGDLLLIPNYVALNQGEILTKYRYTAEFKSQKSINGNIISLNTALNETKGFIAPDGKSAPIVVGNLSRRILFTSAAPYGTRGHIMLLDRADVFIKGVEFRSLGRTKNQPLDNTVIDISGDVTHIGTNQIGRYPLHLHHLYGPRRATKDQTTRQFHIEGCSVWDEQSVDPKKWGIAIHDSHFGALIYNVIYNYAGAGIVTEEGNETGNIIGYNLCIGAAGVIDDPFLQDFGDEDGMFGSGIWLRGTNNIVKDNICINNRRYGIVYETKTATSIGKIPKFPGANLDDTNEYTSIRLDKISILSCYNNTVIGGLIGINLYGAKGQSCRIEQCNLWLNGRAAIFGYYGINNRYSVIDCKLYGGIDIIKDIGISHDRYSKFLIDNCTIVGFNEGIRLLTWQASEIRKTQFLNKTDIVINYQIPMNNATRIVITNPVNLLPGSHRFTPNYFIEMQMPKLTDIFKSVSVELYNVDNTDWNVYFYEQAHTWLIPPWVHAPQTGITAGELANNYGLAVAGKIVYNLPITNQMRILGLVEEMV
jgi:parallel beta-helix repeat protein